MLLSKAFQVVLLGLVGVATSAPAAESSGPCKERILCVDGLNECGVRWGDCYDTCKPHLRPTAPPCSLATSTKPSIVTKVPTSTAEPTTTATICAPAFLCIDGIDDCGNGWGGCYDICKPWMKPQAPATPCSRGPGTTPTITGRATSSTTGPKHTPSCRPLTKCVSGINGCGVRYGGCYDTCNPALAPIAPACASTTAKTITRAPVPTSRPPKEDCRTRTVCVDAVNACGQKYGGCFADCKPWPLSPPPCPASTSAPRPSATQATKRPAE
ncbi:hypothetical protein RB595_009687, partial [Gaeumannomyces hyphopodioides]